LVPTPRFSAYVASKCALDGFSRSIAAELIGDGITVTTINYPLVKTPMTAPTKIYKYLPQMDVEVAAGWIVNAVKNRPARKTSLFGETFGVITTALPGATTKSFGYLFKAVGKRLQKRAEKEQRE
jgi:short-subunit dehydrogenase